MARILSVDKSLDIIEAVAAEPDGIGVRELSRKLGIGVSSAHNILMTLESRGYLRQVPETKVFKLGLKLLGLNDAGRFREAMIEMALPFAKDLIGRIGETVVLASLQNGVISKLFQLDSPHLLRAEEAVVDIEYAHATAYGKVLLSGMSVEAFLSYLKHSKLTKFTSKTLVDHEDIKQEVARVSSAGYAFTCDECVDGVSAVAVPIVKPDGSVVAAIGISAPTTRFGEKDRGTILKELKETAVQISEKWFS